MPKTNPTSGSRTSPPPPTPPSSLPSTNGQSRPMRNVPIIEYYIDPCEGLLSGQRDGNPNRSQAVARYLQDWEDAWQRASRNAKNLQGKPKL